MRVTVEARKNLPSASIYHSHILLIEAKSADMIVAVVSSEKFENFKLIPLLLPVISFAAYVTVLVGWKLDLEVILVLGEVTVKSFVNL